jgi:hypothetical protein
MRVQHGDSDERFQLRALRRFGKTVLEAHRREGTVEPCASIEEPGFGSGGAPPGSQPAQSWPARLG